MGAHKLEIQAGIATETGSRERNEDFAAVYLAPGAEFALRGALAMVADGMGGNAGGREAAETAVRGFLDGYLGHPATLSVERSAARSLAAVNNWIHAQGARDPRLKGMATTFTALILRGREAHVVHVGDTRVYRLRAGALTRLTEDHTLKRPELDHVLYRAVGIEPSLRADYAVDGLKPHDRFLICSDGVYGALAPKTLHALLGQDAAPEEEARRIVEAALAAGSRDNATALVVDVLDVPEAGQEDLRIAIEALPILPAPKAGEVVDDFELLDVISDGRYSRLFRARDRREERELVLKFPQPRVAQEISYRRAFLREAWVAAQVHSPWVAQSVEMPAGRQSRLYSAMPFYRGRTLEDRLRAGPLPLAEGVNIGVRIAKAVYALNRRQVIHRDIKPENVLLVDDGGLKLLDLGVARLPGFAEFPAEDIPGTPSYMAPELFAGASGDERSEVYALGVTLYRLFSGHYPYGEVEPFSTPRFRRRAPLAQYRADLPAWLDAVLARACAVDPAERYADALEFAYDLEQGLLARPAGAALIPLPLYQRNPVLFWQVVAALLLLAWLISLAR